MMSMKSEREYTAKNIESERRFVFYVDTAGAIHPICAYCLDRLLRGESDAALLAMAGRCIGFAVFHVERFTAPPRVISEHFPQLLLDDRGCVDQQRHYDTLQAEVDRLEANDYAMPETAELETAEPATTNPLDPTRWTPDPITHRRLIAALHRLRAPVWHSASPPHAHHQSAA